MAAAALVATGAMLLGSSPVSAHEVREVGDGQYQIVVGFQNEPVFLNDKSGLEFFVSSIPEGVDPETAEEGELPPIDGLEETLQAEVSFGGSEPMALPIDASFGQPGAYESTFFPTAEGDYTFHIFGQIENLAVDEEFTSGPETFSSIEPGVQYPVQVQTNQELEAAIGSGSDEGDDDSNTPMILAVIALVLGGAGLVAGGVALTRGRA